MENCFSPQSLRSLLRNHSLHSYFCGPIPQCKMRTEQPISDRVNIIVTFNKCSHMLDTESENNPLLVKISIDRNSKIKVTTIILMAIDNIYLALTIYAKHLKHFYTLSSLLSTTIL